MEYPLLLLFKVLSSISTKYENGDSKGASSFRLEYRGTPAGRVQDSSLQIPPGLGRIFHAHLHGHHKARKRGFHKG